MAGNGWGWARTRPDERAVEPTLSNPKRPDLSIAPTVLDEHDPRADLRRAIVPR